MGPFSSTRSHTKEDIHQLCEFPYSTAAVSNDVLTSALLYKFSHNIGETWLGCSCKRK